MQRLEVMMVHDGKPGDIQDYTLRSRSVQQLEQLLTEQPKDVRAQINLNRCNDAVAGDLKRASRIIDALRIPYIGPSLGGVESIIEQPALMSHFILEPEERAAIGIKDTLTRYALGIEDAEDLIADLAQALDGLE